MPPINTKELHFCWSRLHAVENIPGSTNTGDHAGLALIRANQAHKLGLPIGVIKSCQNKLHAIEQASTELTLRNMKSWDYKKLQGSELRQIRLNEQYRMRFMLDTATSPATITVTFIGDPH